MSRANDQTTRRIAASIALGVGLFAGADSYVHVYSLARDHGQAILSAALLPLAGDGLVTAGSLAMLVASRRGDTAPIRAYLAMYGGIIATALANVASGLPHGTADALLSAWPVAAYVGCMELLTWMRAHTGAQPKRAASASPAASADASAPVKPAASDDLRERRQHRADADLIHAAEEAFPDGKVKLPPLRTIQTELSVGQPKSQLVQAHFKALGAT